MRPTRQVLYINVLFTLGQYCLCPFPSPRVSLPYIYIQGRSIDQKEERLGNKSVNKVALYRSLFFLFLSSSSFGREYRSMAAPVSIYALRIYIY